MTARYVTKAAAFTSDQAWAFSAETVVETDKAPVPTGILNAKGQMIFREEERVALGFDIAPVKA